ncbi:hypothetical protein B0T25DRAFT_571631 [Lasiosphaeria hispida]|uniref:Uncharacterized protein n=1 Tax=Lasiosphaeria hispida TaxID=260671 RepID=A0AAJ0HBD5_9PEZI|nr:hypothetical protein B0T25DRAFT_571631 [Lasiosphaeria hispida]
MKALFKVENHLSDALKKAMSTAKIEKEQSELRERIGLKEAESATARMSLDSLAKSYERHRDAPETKFLEEVIAAYHRSRGGLIPKLEKVLRCLVDQSVIKVDLLLFIDALDEFEGHVSDISRFLKSLTKKSATSSAT